MDITICNLYPEILNYGGSQGNINVILNTCEWCGWNAHVKMVSLGEKKPATHYDLVFMGDAAPEVQWILEKEFKKNSREILVEAMTQGDILLGCGGSWPYLGKTLMLQDRSIISGMGLLPIEARREEERLVGDVLAKEELTGQSHWLIGFENHHWHIDIQHPAKGLGKIHIGSGNNNRDGIEGVLYKNVICTNFQGAFLGVNFWLTDYILQNILQKKEPGSPYPRLNRELEAMAYKNAIDIAQKRGKKAKKK